jgi:prevent-host-death family protein
MVIMVLVRKTSLAEAKAHLSELVDQAEHHGKRIVILRHGKPAAAIVPVDVAAPKRRRAKALSDEEVRRSVQAFIDEFSAAEPSVSAVDDLIAGRR